MITDSEFEAMTKEGLRVMYDDTFNSMKEELTKLQSDLEAYEKIEKEQAENLTQVIKVNKDLGLQARKMNQVILGLGFMMWPVGDGS